MPTLEPESGTRDRGSDVETGTGPGTPMASRGLPNYALTLPSSTWSTLGVLEAFEHGPANRSPRCPYGPRVTRSSIVSVDLPTRIVQRTVSDDEQRSVVTSASCQHKLPRGCLRSPYQSIPICKRRQERMSEELRHPTGPTSTAEQGKLRWVDHPKSLDASRSLIPVLL